MASSTPGRTVLFTPQYAFDSVNKSWFSHSLRAIDFQAKQDPAPGYSSPVLSGKTLSTVNFTTGINPVILDPGVGLGYYFDTGGFLVCIRLSNGSVAWNVKIPTTSAFLRPYLLPLSGRIVLADPGAGSIAAYDRADGQLRWTRSVAANHLPAAPTIRGGVVLDNDLLLLPFANGDIRAIDQNGNLTPAVVNVPGAHTVIASLGHYLVATDTQLFCYRAANATANPAGQGCNAAAPPPTLTSPPPILGQTVQLTCANATPSVAGLVFAGLPPTNPIQLSKACFFYIDPLVGLFPLGAGITSATGTMNLNVPVPNDPSLVCGQLNLQAVFIPTAGPLGADLTNGLEWTFGY
jgi:hypothetical protein